MATVAVRLLRGSKRASDSIRTIAGAADMILVPVGFYALTMPRDE